MQAIPSIESVVLIIREAGALVKTMQRQVSLSVKQDGSVVTEADISSQNLIIKGLRKITPDIAIISEEHPLDVNQTIQANKTIFWAIDPLDVTANYAGGGDSYSINIALIENGTPILGALYFPGLGELYYAGDSKAFKQLEKEPARAIRVAPIHSGSHTAAVRPNDQVTHMPVSENTLKVIFTRGQRRACLVATGEATFCSEREGFRIWDSAATYAIVSAAGGSVQKHDGTLLRYDETLDLPAYFVGHPELLGHLHAVEPETASPEASKKRKKA